MPEVRKLFTNGGTARFLFFVFLFLVFASRPLLAGDMAERRILGFSPDGRYFAFEQYGVQDGSGFPYADIFILDTRDNGWVPGTPFRSLLLDERAKLTDVRRQTRAKAEALLSRLRIAERGRVLASNPLTEVSANRYRVTIRTLPALPPVGTPYRLTLAEFRMKAPRCTENRGRAVGFALFVRPLWNRRVNWVIARDTVKTGIPEDRGCPLGYGISDVIFFDPLDRSALGGEGSVLVVLLHVFSKGFEGRRGRYLAVAKAGSLAPPKE